MDDSTLSEGERRRRLPVWVAFSDLYLDNETQPSGYKYIARVCHESGYGRDELRAILFEEIEPVFGPNLLQVAGEWEPFSPAEVDDLMRRERPSSRGSAWLFRKRFPRYTAEQWAVLEGWLDRPVEDLEP